jgi:hypothetical protein
LLLVASALPALVSAQSTDTTAGREGRIEARRLDSGRVEFAFRPEGEERILPDRRFFPTNARTGRWLVSSDVASGGDILGQITARLLDDGRIEFGFNPVEGERILPRARFFPTNARTDRWLVSSPITILLADAPAATPTPTATPRPTDQAFNFQLTTCEGRRTVGDLVDVSIAGRATAARDVNVLFLRLTGEANGQHVSVEFLRSGQWRAGQSESFRITGVISTTASRVDCNVSWNLDEIQATPAPTATPAPQPTTAPASGDLGVCRVGLTLSPGDSCSVTGGEFRNAGGGCAVYTPFGSGTFCSRNLNLGSIAAVRVGSDFQITSAR